MSDEEKPVIKDVPGYWKLIISRDNKQHMISKVIPNKVKPDIKTKVEIDLTPDKKGVSTSISEVLYPKYKYDRVDIEKVAEHISEKSKDAECPLCQKIKTAIDINTGMEVTDIFKLPRVTEVLPKPGVTVPSAIDIISPIVDTHEAVISSFNSIIDSLFPGNTITKRSK